MRADLIELIERLKEASEGDHARGCEGRQYSCSCGYDERIFKTAADAAAYLDALASQEPVAWRMTYTDPKHGSFVYYDEKPWTDRPNTSIEPLFASPVVPVAAKAEVTKPDLEIGEFKPGIIVNEDADITEAVFEDVAYVAEPVFPGVYNWIDKHVAMDDGRIVGMAVWATKPAAKAGAEGWRLIDGHDPAPKDGSRFLAVHEKSRVVNVTWYGKMSHVPLYGWCEGEDAENIDLWQPTHWMPLPAAPTGKGDGQ